MTTNAAAGLLLEPGGRPGTENLPLEQTVNHTDPTAETTYLVWYCRGCRKPCKVQPQAFEPSCRCERPVMPLQPTRETQMHAPKRRPMHALTDEEARVREMILSRRRLRITFEADVVKAWTVDSPNSTRQLQLIVRTPDGRRHAVDLAQPGVHIEAADQTEE